MVGGALAVAHNARIRAGMTESVDRVYGWPTNDQYALIQPQINAEDIHVWPFDAVVPVDLRFLTSNGQNTVRMNRHDYFEIIFLCSGAATFLVQDRLLPMNAGDMAIIGSTLYHSMEQPPTRRRSLAPSISPPILSAVMEAQTALSTLRHFLSRTPNFRTFCRRTQGCPERFSTSCKKFAGNSRALPYARVWQSERISR